MRKSTKIVLSLLLVSLVVSAYKAITLPKQEPIVVKQSPLQPLSVKAEIKSELPAIKNHTAFLDAIGHYESGNRYTIVNRFGYMGRYQFGKSTLKSLDINVSRKTFLNSPYLQEEAMDRLLTENYKSLRRYLKKYDGKVVHGVYVTKSGTLAAAHLVGAGAVSKWFRRGTQAKDANGTRLTTYMKVFANYDLDI